MKSSTLFSKRLPYQLETQHQTLRLRYGCFVLFDSTKRPLFYKQRRLLEKQRGVIVAAAVSFLFLGVYAIARPLVMADPSADPSVAEQARRF